MLSVMWWFLTNTDLLSKIPIGVNRFLKPKKFVLGGKIEEQNYKSKCVFRKEIKSFRKDSVLILREGGVF
jgi:hypothetical protein